MRHWHRVLSATVLAGALFGSSVVLVGAQELQTRHHDRDGAGAVFVQANDPSNNQILAYRRDRAGALTLSARFDTGGKGGRVDGAVVDPLASQGSLVYDAPHKLLIGVNAGSDSIYAFRVDGAALEQRQVLSAGGHFPVSVAIHDDLVYVLNAGGSGSVQGYRVEGNRLRAIVRESSNRSLGLTPVTGSTAFLNTPGQVGFTPDGRHLIVTTKANGSHIDVFNVRANGRLSDTPVANPSATPVPFGFTFDGRGRLVVGEAGTSSVSTYLVHDNGTLTSLGSQTDSQAALCWIDRDGRTYFVANAGSGSVSAFRLDAGGHPNLVGTTSVGPGAIDLDHSNGGRFLYVELGGNGSVAAFSVKTDGSLTSIGTVASSATQEGIVAL
jgi:6-phosphogluconolactonase (cycloisomerase 2 family)